MHLDARQVTEQNPVGMQRALGRAGCARRINHHRRIVGGGYFRREVRRGARQRVMKSASTVGRAVDRENKTYSARSVADLCELGQTLCIGDQRLGARILQAV